MSVQSSFLSRLSRNQAGNALAIVAASIIPVVGMLGGGLDMARIYLVRSRMQQACDASVLAGRKSMVGLTWNRSTDEAQARRFFQTNFPDGSLGTSPVDLNYAVDDLGNVTANASTVLPMTLMHVLGFDSKAVAVTCRAELQLPNTDVMFVLDTTGSMADTNPGDSTSKIVSLRTAVQNFYQTLENARTSGSVIRYGFVPYSESVNVGMLLKRDWMVDEWTYQSRRPNGPPETGTASSTSNETVTYTPWVHPDGKGKAESIKSYLPLEACVAPANNFTNSSKVTDTRTGTDSDGNPKTEKDWERVTNGSQYKTEVKNGQCILTETKYTDYITTQTETRIKKTTTSTWTYTNYYWDYGPIKYDVRALKGNLATGLMAGGSITVPVNNNFQNRTITWNGCIEERDTVTGTNYANARDMDIDAVPTTDPATRWRPALPQLVFARTSMTSYNVAPVIRTTSNWQNVGDYMSGSYAVCPYRASRLQTRTATEISNYLTNLTPAGKTYHDIGLIWGGRLISPTGIFAEDNSVATNGGSISRHMIFMTDGQTDTEVNHYDAYGFPGLDRRRSAGLQTKEQQDATVADRTAAICTAIKGKGITLWVIAFGTSLNTLLSNCASPGRAYQANNTAELNARFAEIATQIAQLRITD